MKQTLIALVENKPGVLNRISSLFRRRNFNIESLVVGHSETPGVSRMTIVADEPDASKRGNIYFNLLKLVNVIAVKDVSKLPSVSREFVMIKINISPDELNKVNMVLKKFGARIVDLRSNTAIIEIADEESIINELIASLQSFDISEIVRTGKVVMRCGKTHRVNSDKINTRPGEITWKPEHISSYQHSS
ncbi:MAG: acetolactate synthase small subunit [Fidelibacterota bacterium]